jgi:hypothetical protein
MWAQIDTTVRNRLEVLEQCDDAESLIFLQMRVSSGLRLLLSRIGGVRPGIICRALGRKKVRAVASPFHFHRRGRGKSFEPSADLAQTKGSTEESPVIFLSVEHPPDDCICISHHL